MSDSSEKRYARQIRFSSIGETGHAQIRASKVAILGCGALGTVAAEILTRAGVATLKLIDRDVVEWTNLQRQSLYTEVDAAEGGSKAAAAAERLSQINRDVRFDPIVADVTAMNIGELLGDVDLLIDGTDNFAIRFLINDWSLRSKTAWVHGGCVGASGQVRLFTGLGSPCFRCVVPEPPPPSAVETCDTAGVIGSATHLVASLQATEAIKWLSGNRSSVRTTLLSIDLWSNRIREIEIPAILSQDCNACGRGELEFLEGSRGIVGDNAAALCGRDAVQINRSSSEKFDLNLFAKRWEGMGRVQSTPFFVRLHLDAPHSITLFRDGRVIVNGSDQIGDARILYDRYVGG